MDEQVTPSGSFFARNRPNILLAAGSLLVSLLLVEAGYRFYLARLTGRSQDERVEFSVADKPYFLYDEALGYRYRTNATVDLCTIKDSLPDKAETIYFDSRGNSGFDEDESGCAVRIFVVGDSFTMMQIGGVSWPKVLQQLLREKAGPGVCVLNYGREGYGLLQMVDYASVLVDEKPDAILISFITPDLYRARFWRIDHTSPDGTENFTSTTPTLQLDKPETYVRTKLVEPRATRQWCDEMIRERDRQDPVLRSILDAYVRARDNHSVTRFNPLSLTKSYALQRLLQPSIRPGGSHNPTITNRDYAADARFVAEAAKLKNSGVPVGLIHLPYHPELWSGKYQMNRDVAMLRHSVQSTTGFPLVELLPPRPLGAAADTMIIWAGNPHPNLLGMRYYAEAVATYILEKGLPGRAPDGRALQTPAAVKGPAAR